MDKYFIEERIKNGLTLKNIARELKCGYSTLRKSCKENGIKTIQLRINEKYPKELIENLVKECHSFAELFIKLNIKNSGASYQRVKEKINNFNIKLIGKTGTDKGNKDRNRKEKSEIF